MDPEVATQLCALGEEKFNMWKESATDAQKTVALEINAKAKTDPERMAKHMASLNEHFVAADANADGVLSRDEYLEFMRISEAKYKADGMWVLESSEHDGKFYAVANMITPGTDGVSMADVMSATVVLSKRKQELMVENGM